MTDIQERAELINLRVFGSSSSPTTPGVEQDASSTDAAAVADERAHAWRKIVMRDLV